VRVMVALSGECTLRLVYEDDIISASGLAVLDSGLLASGCQYGSSLQLWSAGTLQRAGSMEGVRGGRLAALPGGRCAAVGFNRPNASVWDAASRTRVCQLQGHTGDAACVAALPGGLVATGGLDHTVRLWTAATGAHVATLQCGRAVLALAALPDGRLASGGGGDIRLWDLPTRACTAVLQQDSAAQPLVHALAALEGGRLASGCSTGAVCLWSPASGALEAALQGHTGAVLSLAALPRGLLASGSGDMTVRVWSVGARACLAVLRDSSLAAAVTALAALPDGRLATASCANTFLSPPICVWELHHNLQQQWAPPRALESILDQL
jgi:WD40 repeat protein